MGRLNTMKHNVLGDTLIGSATNGSANELLSISGAWGSESRGYNSLKQLTGINAGPLSVAYTYPTTRNNGKIISQTDTSTGEPTSGETVTYTYDRLNRLSTAANQTTFRPEWGQGFTYDGFGNLTNVSVTQGSAPAFSAGYDVNNHAGGEDYHGNPGTIYLPADTTSYGATYDVENRLVATGTSSISYSYAPGNKRVWRGVGTRNLDTGLWSTTDEITFWSVNGQKLAEYSVTATQGCCLDTDYYTAPLFYVTQTATNYYFGSKLIKNGNGNYFVYSDRLGSIGKCYPYGIERTSPLPPNGTEKFTGYFRDSESGNDYADQRYTSPGMGRFITPDPMGGGHPADPSSWNKYAYTRGDPINRKDPGGNYDCTVGVGDYAETTDCEDVTVYSGPANPQCMLYLQAASGSPANPVAQEQYETYCAQVGGPSPQNPPPAPAPPPPPTCFGVLVDTIETDLSFFGSPMATYALAYDFVSDAMQDGINPLLLLAMSGAESKFGTSSASQSTQNAFGLTHPVRNANGKTSYPLNNYNYPGGPGWAGGISYAATTVMNQIAKQNNTVSLLYSGQTGAYCVNSPGKPCSTGAANVEYYFELFGGGNPNNPANLLWPCP